MNGNAPVGQPGAGTARGLWFTAARRAELIEEPVKRPSGAEVTVRAIASLVSAGAEMLVYRGELPAEDDLGLETCAGNFGFPVKYAYQVAGEVIEAGPDARSSRARRSSFAIPTRTCSPSEATAGWLRQSPKSSLRSGRCS
jgi:hypothetical protein